MKGIILAAGKGTRLGPITLGMFKGGLGVPKPLVPAYDKPTIYYPLANLISAGIHEILIICAPDSLSFFEAALGDGRDMGVSLSYAVQPEPKGTADALVIAEQFAGNDDVALIYGDNVIVGDSIARAFSDATKTNGATLFAYRVANPGNFGVVEFDEQYKVLSIEEKPAQPKSNYAVLGVYFFRNDAIRVAKGIEMSERGEYEINGVNDHFLDLGKLEVVILGPDTQWFDTGNPQALNEASNYICRVQEESKSLIGSPELAAYKAGLIDKSRLVSLALPLLKSEYGKTLERIASE